MTWTIEQILNYPEEKPWGQGYAHYGFHDSQGNRYFFDYFHHWVGRLGTDDEFLWTAGVRPDVTTGFHMDADFLRPMFLTEAPDGSLLISCDGNARIFRVDLSGRAEGTRSSSQPLELPSMAAIGDLLLNENRLSPHS